MLEIKIVDNDDDEYNNDNNYAKDNEDTNIRDKVGKTNIS